MLPVLQNLQASLHPTCEDMHKVMRAFSGISTDSTNCPSGSLKTNFAQPSFFETQTLYEDVCGAEKFRVIKSRGFRDKFEPKDNQSTM